MLTLEQKLNKLIFRAASELLREQETPPAKKAPAQKKKRGRPRTKKRKTIVVAGAMGSGLHKTEIEINASRAVNDPMGLSRDLGLSFPKGKTDLDKAADIIRQAIHENETMAEAFTEIKAITTAKNANNENVPGYTVSLLTGFPSRSGVKFLYATLLAAENAGILKMSKGVGFSNRHSVETPTLYALN